MTASSGNARFSVAKLTIIFNKRTGTTEISVDGVAGPGCKDLTKGLEDALGGTIEHEELLPEYQQPATGETAGGIFQ